MLVLDNFILSLGFCSQNNYLPRDRKGYESFPSMIDPTAIILIWIFTQIQKRADMTSRMIRSSLSDRPFSPVSAKEECCESHDLFSCQVTDCSATRILSSSITGRHPQPTGSFVVLFFLPLCRGAVSVFYSPSQLGGHWLHFKIFSRFSSFWLIKSWPNYGWLETQIPLIYLGHQQSLEAWQQSQ